MYGYFKITKREVLASVSIIAILLVIGLMISDKISNSIFDRNEKYNKAIKIKDTDIFEYSMRTNVGNAFVYGDLEAKDTVSYEDIDGEYMYVKKCKEKYTMHTRTRTVKVGKTTQTRTEVYWTWDLVSSESKNSKELIFCGIAFPYKKINIPGAEHIDTVDGGYHIRYVYYGTPAKTKGTIFTKLNNGTISDNSDFYENRNLKEAYESSITSGTWLLILFWIFWLGLIAACIYGFYYLENDWLED